jgi:FkbM family methyltransferase
VAFEPLPRNLKFLSLHVGTNHAGNTAVIDSAVGECSGEAFFDDTRPHDMGSISESGGLRVRLVSIDDLVESGTIQAPAVMKIDVEGFEEPVLRGARRTMRTHRPIIMLSTHSAPLFERCAGILREAGYGLHGPAFDRPACDEILALPCRS